MSLQQLNDEVSMKVSRRNLLAGAAGIVALGKGAAMQAPAAPTDPTKIRGTPTRALGQRAPAEKPQRQLRSAAVSGTPHQDLYGTITPSDLHFERHHAGVPDIDPRTYSLLIHGMVERPMVFTLAELKRFPAVSRVYFLECSGNFGGRGATTEITPQQLAGLTSTSEWTGVPLATLFREVGASPKATWFLAEGQDAAVMTRSIPVAKAYDDALVAYGQNGEAIRPEQGYPARLFLPGWEGNANVKWLRRIELSDRPFMTREETSKYTDPMADGTARIFSFLMDARSLITYPAYPVMLARGWLEINGIAWTGSGRIMRVDVSTDGGTTWTPARLQEPVLSKAHTRFRHLWNWTGGEAVLMSRAVDEAGYVQPTRDALIAERGVGSAGSVSYHTNPITGWLVRPDGTVVYHAEPWS
jgi:sulfane dehydrogenase subunit SoxC